MTVVRRAETRRTATPNAVMTTYASASLGGSATAMWRVEMAPDASGPRHRFDVEQVWTVLDGTAEVLLDGETTTVGAGDTLVLPAGLPRRIHADPAAGFTALVAGASAAHAIPEGGEPVTPAWIA
jgi:quercetin dioxygenase-like cupin family protein